MVTYTIYLYTPVIVEPLVIIMRIDIDSEGTMIFAMSTKRYKILGLTPNYQRIALLYLNDE